MRNVTTDSHVEAHQGEPSGLPQGNTDGFLAQYDVTITPELLELALTHRSWAYEHGGAPHNERLEFLGDSVLGQAVTARLYHDFPKLSENELAKRRAALVSTVALAEVARTIGLGPHIKLGIGEERTGGREKESILADTVEALIGAAFLSSNADQAATFVLKLIVPLMSTPGRFTTTLDPKTSLQEAAFARGLPFPSYDIASEGPDHDRRFTASVSLAGVTGTGTGTSKKVAELAAARDAVAQLHAGKGDPIPSKKRKKSGK